jgi:FixJ family two-component response regulator
MKAPVISIVDDDQPFREAITGLVRSLGYGTAAFASSEDFLQSDQLNDTACLITDVQMPSLSGVELQNRMIAQGNRTPIIFVSAFPEERIRARAVAAGAVGFLSKPFSDDRLIEYLRAALNGGKGGKVEP